MKKITKYFLLINSIIIVIGIVVRTIYNPDTFDIYSLLFGILLLVYLLYFDKKKSKIVRLELDVKEKELEIKLKELSQPK